MSDAATPTPTSPWHQRWSAFWNRLKNGRPPVEEAAAGQLNTSDRTRTAIVLSASVIGLLVVFVAMFSSEPSSARPQVGHVKAGTMETPKKSPGSVTPLTSAAPEAEERDNDVTAADIAGTARKREESKDAALPPLPTTPPPPSADYALARIPREPVPPPSAPPAAKSPSPVVAPSPAVDTKTAREELRKPSLVFVRRAVEATAPVAPTAGPQTGASPLAAGTKLFARLLESVSSAVKTPVIAAVEYHYELDGEIVVPAGTRLLGELEQATANGLVQIKFNRLIFADGREEPIEANAVNLDNGPLRGSVSGTNRGRRILARTLTGVGTLAAYTVGGGGMRLGGPIDNSVLLRDRLAQNIGMAGEQELMSASYGQRVVTTVPANTRFYAVIQRPIVPLRSPSSSSSSSMQSLPTAAELRHLIELKQELANLYQRPPVVQSAEAQER